MTVQDVSFIIGASIFILVTLMLALSLWIVLGRLEKGK